VKRNAKRVASIQTETETDLNFICPITQQLFRDPRIIIEYGHTVDKDALLNLVNKKCPVCICNFEENPRFFPINWNIVSYLGISIAINNNIDNYTVDQARADCKKYILNKAKEAEPFFLNIIKDKARKGEYNINIECLNNLNVHICYKLEEMLKRKGYNASYNSYKKIININYEL